MPVWLMFSGCTICYYKFQPDSNQEAYVVDSLFALRVFTDSKDLIVEMIPLKNPSVGCKLWNDTLSHMHSSVEHPSFEKCLFIDPYFVSKNYLKRKEVTYYLGYHSNSLAPIYRIEYNIPNNDVRKSQELHIFYQYKTDSCGTEITRSNDVVLSKYKYCYERGLVMH